jgi:hypothetical protein
MVADVKVQDQYERLLAALAEGWTVEPPVYAMSDPTRPKQVVYQFILWRDSQPGVATVHDGPEVRRFIDEQSLKLEPLY